MTIHIGGSIIVVDYREILRLNSLKYAMQVDLADTTIPYYDRVTGEAADSYLFVAVLPCSSHPKSATNRREPVIQPEHMPTEHRKYLSYD